MIHIGIRVFRINLKTKVDILPLNKMFSAVMTLMISYTASAYDGGISNMKVE